jgi:hypothetical protein
MYQYVLHATDTDRFLSGSFSEYFVVLYESSINLTIFYSLIQHIDAAPTRHHYAALAQNLIF